MKQLFCDCKTDEEKANFFLSGRAVETGIIAPAISNDVAMAYHRCAEFQKEIDALRAKIEQMKKQAPFDADSDVFRSAFEAALKAGNWPAARQADGYRSPSTQIAWRIAFSTVNRLKLYALPGTKGE